MHVISKMIRKGRIGDRNQSTQDQQTKEEVVNIHIKYHTSVMLSSNLAMVSRRFNLAFSMASSLTRTASILDTILPMECSMRSTRRLSLIDYKIKQRLMRCQH